MARTKEYVVRASVQGLRNGERWPAPGEKIRLDKDEADQYLALGYVSEHEPVEADLALVGTVIEPPVPDLVEADSTGLGKAHGGDVPGNADVDADGEIQEPTPAVEPSAAAEEEPEAKPRAPRVKR